MDKKICITQLSDEPYYKLRKHCVNSVSKYCNKMSYTHDGIIGTLDKKTHIAYQKPIALLRNIDKYKYVGWMDMDITISNPTFDLFEYLEGQTSDVVICKDPSFAINEVCNSGVVFFRSSEISKLILNKWWNLRVEGTDKPWRHQDKIGTGADQYYLNKILKELKIKPQNPHDLNIHPKHFSSGDFAIHFMGFHPIDYSPYVEFANKNISDQSLLNYYWKTYSFQCLDKMDRYYLYDNTDHLHVKNTPEQIFNLSKQIHKHNLLDF